MSTPKKRRAISLQLKKEVIEATGSLAELSKQFDLPRSTIKNIRDSKVAILSAINEGGEAKRTHLMPVKHEDLEEAVLRWVKSVRSQTPPVPVTGPLVMATEKALILAKELADPATLKLFDQLDDALAKERFNKLKQKTLTSPFLPTSFFVNQ